MIDLNPDKMARYKATARQRTRQAAATLAQRFAHAQQIAQQAALLLKTRYAVGRVVVFGSLVHPALFHLRSDIDLAVWGLDERAYYRAVGELQALDPAFSIDLIRVEDTQAALCATIEQEGVVL